MPLLISAAGDDAAGAALVADLKLRGLPTHGILRSSRSSDSGGGTSPVSPTAMVSIVFDASGEVQSSTDIGM